MVNCEHLRLGNKERQQHPFAFLVKRKSKTLFNWTWYVLAQQRKVWGG